jgi:3-deoxy-D-manno-octulosonic-acid transferase
LSSESAKYQKGWGFLSLHARELSYVLPVLKKFPLETPLRIFPRHLKEIPEFLLALQGLGFTCHSQNPRANRLLVDALGEVERLLPGCSEVVLGGSWFPSLGHNLFEPLSVGARVHVGPFYEPHPVFSQRIAQMGFLIRHPGVLDFAAIPPMPGAESQKSLQEILHRQRDLAENQRQELARRVDTAFLGEPEFASFLRVPL